MSKEIFSLKSLVGLDKEFIPDYQFENPTEFDALVKWYMKSYHNPDELDLYPVRTQHAVRHANKSIMLDKLRLGWDDDVEETNPELFKSIFSDLAKSESGLMVDNNGIFYSDSLVKSVDGSNNLGNALYERLWKKAFDTIRQTDACRDE